MKEIAFRKPPSFLEKLIRLVYPVKCMVCDALLCEDSPLLICEACMRTLPRYGRGFHRIPQLPFIDGVLAAYFYEEGVDTAVHNLKFNHQPRLAPTMGYLLYNEFLKEAVLPDFDMILPVPMHQRKKRQRGYNQSELIARELSFYLDVPVCPDLLVKTRQTRPQSRLKREERLTNMVDAFSLKKGADVEGRNILLVDDVLTTGTTLNTCAKILNENGASFVFASVMAIAEK